MPLSSRQLNQTPGGLRAGALPLLFLRGLNAPIQALPCLGPRRAPVVFAITQCLQEFHQPGVGQ